MSSDSWPEPNVHIVPSLAGSLPEEDVSSTLSHTHSSPPSSSPASSRSSSPSRTASSSEPASTESRSLPSSPSSHGSRSSLDSHASGPVLARAFRGFQSVFGRTVESMTQELRSLRESNREMIDRLSNMFQQSNTSNSRNSSSSRNRSDANNGRLPVNTANQQDASLDDFVRTSAAASVGDQTVPPSAETQSGPRSAETLPRQAGLQDDTVRSSLNFASFASTTQSSASQLREGTGNTEEPPGDDSANTRSRSSFVFGSPDRVLQDPFSPRHSSSGENPNDLSPRLEDDGYRREVDYPFLREVRLEGGPLFTPRELTRLLLIDGTSPDDADLQEYWQRRVETGTRMLHKAKQL